MATTRRSCARRHASGRVRPLAKAARAERAMPAISSTGVATKGGTSLASGSGTVKGEDDIEVEVVGRGGGGEVELRCLQAIPARRVTASPRTRRRAKRVARLAKVPPSAHTSGQMPPVRFLLVLLSLSCASGQPPRWLSRAQPYRDQQAAGGSYGPGFQARLFSNWTVTFVSTPPGVTSETVADSSAVYALSSYERSVGSTLSAWASTPPGATLWSTSVSHTGGQYYAFAGLQLTAAGGLVSSAVSPSTGWHTLTSLSTADGSVQWQLNASDAYDHVSVQADGLMLTLANYGSDANPGGLIDFVDARTGNVTVRLPGLLCVSPVVTSSSIACYCDGMAQATHICGYAPDGSQLWKVGVPARRAATFPTRGRSRGRPSARAPLARSWRPLSTVPAACGCSA